MIAVSAHRRKNLAGICLHIDTQVNTCITSGMRVVVESSDIVFKALADPNRRELIDRLHAKNGQTLGELCKGLDMARQSVTQHLGLLQAANLVSIQWQGREKRHYFNPVPIHEIYERWIRKFERPHLEALHNLKVQLERKLP